MFEKYVVFNELDLHGNHAEFFSLITITDGSLYISLSLQTKKKPTGEEWVKLEESPNYKNGNKLRAYQLEGLNWLLFSWYNG
jgi:hypothetical protein